MLGRASATEGAKEGTAATQINGSGEDNKAWRTEKVNNKGTREPQQDVLQQRSQPEAQHTNRWTRRTKRAPVA